MTETQVEGTVYLLHFETPYKHARHYMGFAYNVERRIEEHRNGNGARLMQAVVGAGIDFVIARTWEGCTEADEARLKDRRERKPSPAMRKTSSKRGKGGSRFCPICKEQKKNGQ